MALSVSQRGTSSEELTGSPHVPCERKEIQVETPVWACGSPERVLSQFKALVEKDPRCFHSRSLSPYGVESQGERSVLWKKHMLWSQDK